MGAGLAQMLPGMGFCLHILPTSTRHKTSMKKANTAPPIAVVTVPPDLKRLHQLCQLNATANRELDLEKAKVAHEFNALVSRHADYIIELQATAERTIAGIEELVRQNPGWLGDKRQLKTPHGTIKLTATSSLSIPDEVDTLARLEARAKRDREFDATLYFRDSRELNKEALQAMTTGDLARLGIVRVASDSFKFTLASVDINKALAESLPPKAA